MTPRSRTTVVTQDQLSALSQRLPHDKYSDLCIMLGIPYNSAMNTLARFNNNYRLAYLEILMEWRNRTGGVEQDLIDVLRNTNLGGFSNEL